MDRHQIEEMLREYEMIRAVVSARIDKLRAMLGEHPTNTIPYGISPLTMDDSASRIQDTISRRRQEIMEQAERARDDAMRQASEGMAAAKAQMGGLGGMAGMGLMSVLPIARKRGEGDGNR